MRRMCSTFANERGGVLVGVTIFTVIMLLSALAILRVGGQDAALSVRDVRTAESFYLAEAGVERGESWLEAQDSYPEAGLRPFGDDPQWLGDGEYLVEIVPDSAHSTPTRPAFTIRSTGTSVAKTRTVEVDVVPQTFGDFLYFTDNELSSSGATIWFVTPDYINGPMHTNGQMHLWGDPRFGGNVASAWGGPDDSDPSHDPTFEYFNGDYYNHIESSDPSNPPHDIPIFEGGYELGANAIPLPNNLSGLAAVAADGGITLTGNYEVIISRDDPVSGDPMYGTLSYRIPGHSWHDLDLDSFNGVFYVDGDVTVRGELDGRLTIGASDDIRIWDDVTYRASDENGPTSDCDDMLGMVAGDEIIVVDNAPNQDDCVIHAHLMALNNFTAEHYNSGSPRGDLVIRGGVVQGCRGPVGTGFISGNEVYIMTGYAKDYAYDWRLRETPPPGYLLTGCYTRVAWRDGSSA
jgi:Tfp pilus assembly protein PilX